MLSRGHKVIQSTATTATCQVFHATGSPITLENVKIPVLGPGELLVRITKATICGSDLHTINGTRKEPTPLILGHEGVGVVDQVGPSNRRGIKSGTRVTWSIADSCGNCNPCSQYALPQKCDKLFKYGHASLESGSGLNGSYSSHVIIRSGTHVVELPQDISDTIAAPANCALATICEAVSAESVPESYRTSVLVQGAGLLGVYAVAWLKFKLGIKQVYCVDHNEGRLALAEKFGAISVPWADRKKIKNVDLVLEVAGASELVPEGLQALRFGGHYVFVGMVHPKTSLSITGETIIRKMAVIRGVHNYSPAALTQAVSFLSQMKSLGLPLDQLVCPDIYPLSKLSDAVKRAETDKSYLRVAVDCSKAISASL